MTISKSILSADQLAAIRNHIETRGHIAVVHWHWCGARSPTPLGFSDFDQFLEYLRESGMPGDAFDVWPFPDDYDRRLAEGKIPDANGNIPTGGAY